SCWPADECTTTSGLRRALLMPFSILRSMTSERGSITSVPSRCPAELPFIVIRLRLSSLVFPFGFEDECPDPVVDLGAARQHTLGLEDLDGKRLAPVDEC